ncbi:MAG: adenylate/guanylate cyclase domain-containing protein [Candidatus Kapaibacterium sp.]|nr:tetratricopeptide repeat protein [Bacteroidota bacterium]
MTLEELISTVEELEAILRKGEDFALVETRTSNLLQKFPLVIENTDLVERDKLQCRILLIHSQSLIRRGMTLDALPYTRQALDIAKQSSLKNFVAIAVGLIGTIYWQLSDYVLALENYQEALTINKELGNDSGAAANLGNIALVYWHLSDFTKALEYLQEALILNKRCGIKRGMAANLGNIGGVYAHLSNQQLALEYMLKALAIYEDIDSKDGVAIWTGNIGTVYADSGDHILALEWYQKALALHQELGNKIGIQSNLFNMGEEYLNLADYTNAMEYHQKAHMLSKESGSKREIATDFTTIGALYSMVEYEGYNPGIAQEYLLKAIDQLQELGVKKELYEAHRTLAGLFQRLEQWKDHSYHFMQYHNIEKEVQNEEVTKQMQLMEYRRKVEEAERDRQVKIARFQEQEKILHNILPAHIAERMLNGESKIADSFSNVSIFFSDIVGFTKLSQNIEADDLVTFLNALFTEFDRLARKHGLEKIKTIGDAYMAVAGAPIAQENHAERAALFALDVAELMKDYRTESDYTIGVRIGLHSGSVVAGIIGENKFVYDLWGDAVNTASRMESHGEPGKIHVSEEFVDALSLIRPSDSTSQWEKDGLRVIPRGEIDIKGKGTMRTFFLERR